MKNQIYTKRVSVFYIKMSMWMQYAFLSNMVVYYSNYTNYVDFKTQRNEYYDAIRFAYVLPDDMCIDLVIQNSWINWLSEQIGSTRRQYLDRRGVFASYYTNNAIIYPIIINQYTMPIVQYHRNFLSPHSKFNLNIVIKLFF